MRQPKRSLRVAVAYNEPAKDRTDKVDIISEAGVLDEAAAVFEAAEKLGHKAEHMPLRSLNDCMKAVEAMRPDLIFNLCEGLHGNASMEMHVAALWELMGIPYTGNTPLTLGIAQDKVLTKRLMESRKIHTPSYQVFRTVPETTCLEFPVIAKPSREDASLGITQDSVVRDQKALSLVVGKLLHKYGQPVLVETFITGREFNISVVGGHKPRVLAISEIDFSGLSKDQVPITSYEAKWLTDHAVYKKTPPVCPAVIGKDLKDRLEDAAVQVYKLLGGRDYGRVDTRVDGRDRIYILEFNPNPDISPDAGFARAVKAAGMSYTDFVEMIIEGAINRSHDE